MRRPGRDATGFRGTAGRDRYELVFLLLVVSYVLGAFLADDWPRTVTLILYLGALLLALRSSRMPEGVSTRLRWVLLLGTVAVGTAILVASGRVVDGLAAAWLAVVLLCTVLVVLRRILSHQLVTLQTIFGALSAYLLIGFMFAALYTAVAKLDTAPFFTGGQPVTGATMQYFSFITLTTTGYGDFTAAEQGGRALAAMEALFGQIFLVTLVARLVAMFGRPRQHRPGRSPTPEEAVSPATDDAGSAGTGDAAG
jgi:Ion channel